MAKWIYQFWDYIPNVDITFKGYPEGKEVTKVRIYRILFVFWNLNLLATEKHSRRFKKQFVFAKLF